MIRILLAVAALAALPLLGARSAQAQGDEQTLVDRATLAVQELVTEDLTQDTRKTLEHARAVMICPRVFRAGFILGGEGGSCVMLARAGNGTWSYPAFYGMGSGSIGLQAGIQDAQIILMIMTEKGLNAMLNSQFKLGADASLAIATIGAGIQGATTGALGADIVAVSRSRGLFAGISLQGSLMGQRSEWNRTYYGRDMGSREIVMEMQGSNPGADPLREVLTRFGNGEVRQASVPAPAGQSPSPIGGAPVQLQPQAQVQQQSLPPPR